MSFQEPLPKSNTAATRDPSNPYQGRWRWWYSAIADEMLRDPKITNVQIAKNIGRGATTVAAIVTTDMFKTYFAQRRQEYTARHDQAIRNKLLGVTEAALDVLTTHFTTKKDQVPMKMAHEVASGMLEKLGYGTPTGPQVVVNNTADNRTQTVQIAPASLSELEEARNALRMAEARRPIPIAPLEPAEVRIEELMEDRQGASSE